MHKVFVDVAAGWVPAHRQTAAIEATDNEAEI